MLWVTSLQKAGDALNLFYGYRHQRSSWFRYRSGATIWLWQWRGQSGPACKDRHGRVISSLACDDDSYHERCPADRRVSKLGRTHMGY